MNQIEENHEEILKKIENLKQSITDRLDNMDNKIEPMYEMFTSVSGFNRISIWILKFLAAIGTAIIGIYAIIEFFRRVGKS